MSGANATDLAECSGVQHNPHTKKSFKSQDIVEPTSHHDEEEDGTDTTPSIDIYIDNVVSTFSLHCPLDLEKIQMEGIDVEYKKGRVRMRFCTPKATCMIYASGKVTIFGNKSEENARESAGQCAREIQKKGYPVSVNDFKVVNVVGTCALPFGIKLAKFAEDMNSGHPRVAEYEPEVYPAVIYRRETPKATLEIFSTGSITVIAPCVENIDSAIQHIYPLVEPHATKLRKDVISKKKMNKVKKQKRIRKCEDNENNDRGSRKGGRGGTSSRKDNKRTPLGVIN